MTRVFDLAMMHKLDSDDFFIHRVQQHCAERRLRFFLIEPLWVELFLGYLASNKVWAKVFLNMHSEHHDPSDIYHRLLILAASRGAQLIDPPDVALVAFDKARMHYRLVESGIAVPPTVIVPRAEIETFRLSEEQSTSLGKPFIIKPSFGYGRKGLVFDAAGESDLQKSLAGFPDPNYLVQRKIQPAMIGDDPAYFRVYNAFGSVWMCWWNFQTDKYRALTPAEIEQHRLQPLADISRRIAQLSGMRFFSTEIALTSDSQFIAIDYVNDQCHLLSQSADPARGVPDEIVAAIAHRLVEGAAELITKAA